MDEWDSIINLESDSVASGERAGAEAALIKSKEEGYKLGWCNGGQLSR